MLAGLFFTGGIISAGLLAVAMLAKAVTRATRRLIVEKQQEALKPDVAVTITAKGNRRYWSSRLANNVDRLKTFGDFFTELSRLLIAQVIANMAAYAVCVYVSPILSVFVFLAVLYWHRGYCSWDRLFTALLAVLCLDKEALCWCFAD